MARKLLVTAALPYSNGPLHIGHLAGAYLPADIYVRHLRQLGHDVVFICGADEHGVAITIAAMQQGCTPQHVVDKYYTLNRDSFAGLGILFDNYSRTSLPVHHKTSQEFFLTLQQKKKLAVRETTQLFCPQDAMFLSDRYVRGTCPVCGNPDAKGDQCEKCGSSLDPLTLKNPLCALCGTAPIIKPTKHWYLPLGDYQPQLEAWLAEKKDWKDNVRNYCKGWFKEGLRERAITRDLDWGVPVPVPEAKGKVLYVWFEAPIGYISATKEWAAQQGDADRWREYWCNPSCELVHFIGKDNIVFHAIFWPAMLMDMHGYILPTQIPANEFLNLEGRKLSTSRNFAVWLPDYLQRFPPDLLRYALAANLPETKDTDFSWKQFQSCNNDELADILGNLVNRTLTFVQRYCDGCIPPAGSFNAADNAMLAEIETAGEELTGLINTFKIRAATARMMDLARAANRYFDASQPWATRTSDGKRCKTTLHVCCQVLRSLAVFMQPFLPFSATALWKMLGLDGCATDVRWVKAYRPGNIAGIKLGELSILFRKLEDADIQPEVDALAAALARIEQKERAQAPPPAAAAPAAAPVAPVAPRGDKLIGIDEFSRVELRVAEIVAAEAVPKATKLLKLTVSLGTEQRTVVAGIAKQYTPAQLLGKKVVLVANLAPATLRGVQSQGMVLAASDGDHLALLTLDRDMPVGSVVR
jgi:methionyl-tRNA synthetase